MDAVVVGVAAVRGGRRARPEVGPREAPRSPVASQGPAVARSPVPPGLGPSRALLRGVAEAAARPQ